VRTLAASRALRCARQELDGGFTLIEVIAAIVVFSIAAVSIVAMLATSLGVSRQVRQRVIATSIAAQEMQTVRAQVKDGVAITLGQTSRIQVMGGVSYTITRTASWIALGQTADPCSGGVAGQIAYQRVSVSVSWPNMGKLTKPVTSESVITPAAGSLSANTITIPVRIMSGAVAAQNGIVVTVTPVSGGASQSEVTDSNGCAAFAQLTPGNYTISLNTSGYVDTQGVQNHTQTAGQSAAGTLPVQTILYDVFGGLSMTAAPTTGYALPVTALKYSVVQTGWTTSPQTFTGGAGSLATVTPVFPFTAANGGVYTSYAGVCTDASPNGYAAPNGVTPVAAPSGLVTASSTTALTVPLASLQASFKTSAGGAVANATVVAKSAKVGCTDTYTLTGTTDASGNLSFSVPYGAWNFTATGSVGAGAVKAYNSTASTTLTPYTATTQAVTVA
jgi:prepilin-type N-terminal cleavage/methylation domain-containing protein